MSTAKRLTTAPTAILLVVSIVRAQEQSPAGGGRSTITVTAVATVDRVRFTAPSTVVQMRIEIYASNGGSCLLVRSEAATSSTGTWRMDVPSGFRTDRISAS
jgi:hypothetical protein